MTFDVRFTHRLYYLALMLTECNLNLTLSVAPVITMSITTESIVCFCNGILFLVLLKVNLVTGL